MICYARKARIMSIDDHQIPHGPTGNWDNPYTPGTPLGDAYRWYEVRKSEPLIDPGQTPYTGKIPVLRIAATFILGMWGAIILALFL